LGPVYFYFSYFFVTFFVYKKADEQRTILAIESDFFDVWTEQWPRKYLSV